MHHDPSLSGISKLQRRKRGSTRSNGHSLVKNTVKVLHGGAEKSPNGLSEQWVSGFDMLHPKTGRAFRLLQACSGRLANITGTENTP